MVVCDLFNALTNYSIRMKKLFIFALSSLFLFSSRSFNPLYTEPNIGSKPARIKSCDEREMFNRTTLVINKIDGVKVKRSMEYLVAPGKRTLTMDCLVAGFSANNINVDVTLKPGGQYKLYPLMGEIKQEYWSLHGSGYSAPMIPLVIDERTNKLVYPDLKKK